MTLTLIDFVICAQELMREKNLTQHCSLVIKLWKLGPLLQVTYYPTPVFI
jgi:hypothetical protein